MSRPLRALGAAAIALGLAVTVAPAASAGSVKACVFSKPDAREAVSRSAKAAAAPKSPSMRTVVWRWYEDDQMFRGMTADLEGLNPVVTIHTPCTDLIKPEFEAAARALAAENGGVYAGIVTDTKWAKPHVVTAYERPVGPGGEQQTRWVSWGWCPTAKELRPVLPDLAGRNAQITIQTSKPDAVTGEMLRQARALAAETGSTFGGVVTSSIWETPRVVAAYVR